MLCLLCCRNHPLVEDNAPLHGTKQHVHILNKTTDDCYLSFTFFCQLGRSGCPAHMLRMGPVSCRYPTDFCIVKLEMLENVVPVW